MHMHQTNSYSWDHIFMINSTGRLFSNETREPLARALNVRPEVNSNRFEISP